jgi:phosphoribosylformylglycinamidine synthase
LYNAITDCGAGGFSSAVGEMGEEIGAEVWLERAPLKYSGLSYTEIWISESQERMVLSVPAENVDELRRLCAAEDVEATVLGRFVPSGRLVLKYDSHVVGDLAMDFLHTGRPPVVRQAIWSNGTEISNRKSEVGGTSGTSRPLSVAKSGPTTDHGRLTTDQSSQSAICNLQSEFATALRAILSSFNVASKEWIIRQYDHEVQGGSVVKPLVGVREDGPSDAAVLRPVPGSRRGVVLACGMNPRYGDFDPYHMAASAIDEAVRNCVAVGADPARIALLDNFCWGDCERPATLGSLVRAAIACHDIALALGTPFISGKDSLNNEFTYTSPADGTRRTIAIPPTLLISAMGQVEDVSRCVTMDLKEPGNYLYQVGLTRNELGGSHWHLVTSRSGGIVPGLGARIDANRAPCDLAVGDAAIILFSESNSRFLCEVAPDAASAFESILAQIPHGRIGQVDARPHLSITFDERTIIDCDIEELKQAWQAPLRW